MPIKTENLSFSYNSTLILERVNLDIRQGEFIGVMGPNGGGKTTLLKLLMGFLKPTAGKVIAQGSIGYVPQAHRTDRDFPITVWELILLGALSKTTRFGIYPAWVKQKAEELMEQLGLLPHRDQVFGSLSGGFAQRALLARALLADPDLLFLDEATANIDAPSVMAIFKLLASLKGKKTILLVTHDLKTILEQVDRMLCVQRGVHSFLPKEVCEHFALGLYHTPLLDLPANHFHKEEAHVHCVH